MKKLLLLIAVILIAMPTEAGKKEMLQMLKITLHEIEIEDGEVKEKLIFTNIGKKNYSDIIEIWICGDKAKAIFSGREKEFFVIDNNLSINLSHYGLRLQPSENFTISLEYKYKGDFIKKIYYRTDKMKIKVITDKFIRGNIPLEYKDGFYYAEFKPNDDIKIEFYKEKKEDKLPYLMGAIAIFLGIIIILLAIRKR